MILNQVYLFFAKLYIKGDFRRIMVTFILSDVGER